MAAPTDTYQLLHYNMVHAHQTFKRGYEIILSNLQTPPSDDLKNFMGYCEAWAVSIEGHHETEEHVIFPFLNSKMDFSNEAEQHKLIHDGLGELCTMIKEAQTDISKFDAAKMNAKMIALKDPLFTHLDDEVEHLTADKIKEAGFSERDLLTMIADMESHAKSHGDPFIIVPYMRSHTPADIKDFWPPMPWILRKLVIPYVLAKRYSGYWKYAPYAMS